MRAPFLIVCALLVLGCQHGSPQAKAMPAAAGTDPVAAPAVVAASPDLDDYLISPSDVLEISVFQEEDMKSTVRVSENGTIGVPLIGTVTVENETPRAVARDLARRLAQGYLINPQVSVSVLEFSKRRFTVLGEVQHPGMYDMPDRQDVTVLQAIGIAGGYTRIANAKKVTLMRRAGPKPETFQFDLRKMAAGRTDSAVIVHPGDVITVAESLF